MLKIQKKEVLKMIENKKRGRKRIKPSEEELAELYKTMTAKEVGEHYGVKESTVRRWITEYRKGHENAKEN